VGILAFIKVAKLEQAAGTRITVHHIYLLENGQRVESPQLYQNGEDYCLQVKMVKKD
jgi:hypothetical protein